MGDWTACRAGWSWSRARRARARARSCAALLERPELRRPALGLGDDPAAPARRARRGRLSSSSTPEEFEAAATGASSSNGPRSTAISTGRPPSRSARRWPRGDLRHPGDRRPGGAAGPRDGPRRPVRLHPDAHASTCSSSGCGPRDRRRGDDPAPAGQRPRGARAGPLLRRPADQRRPRPVRRRPGRAADPNTAVEADPSMLEELKEEEIVNKVGGRFKLSTLIQKRMIALNQGARPLVDIRGARQDGDRDPGDHAGQDLPRPDGQPPDERADRGARKAGRSILPSRQNSRGRRGRRRSRGRGSRKRRPAPAADHEEDETGRGGPARGRGRGRPGAAAPAMRRGSTDARPTATGRDTAPASALLLAWRLPRAEPGRLRPGRPARARRPSPPNAPPANPCGPVGRDARPRPVPGAGLGVVPASCWALGGRRPAARSAAARSPSVGLRLLGFALVARGRRGLVQRFAPGLRPSPPVGSGGYLGALRSPFLEGPVRPGRDAPDPGRRRAGRAWRSATTSLIVWPAPGARRWAVRGSAGAGRRPGCRRRRRPSAGSVGSAHGRPTGPRAATAAARGPPSLGRARPSRPRRGRPSCTRRPAA